MEKQKKRNKKIPKEKSLIQPEEIRERLRTDEKLFRHCYSWSQTVIETFNLNPNKLFSLIIFSAFLILQWEKDKKK